MSKILVVDDSMVIRKIVIKAVEVDGHETVQAENGLEAFDLFQADKFDLIITDINMPIMNGFEFSKKVRSDESVNSEVPIIVLSTEFSDDMKTEGKALGVNAWMVKPPDNAKLLKGVTALLNK
jgi:two-component system chemotaxis response regulator CheY